MFYSEAQILNKTLDQNTGLLQVETGAASGSATAAETNVASSTSNVVLLASNSTRKGCAIFNDSTANLYVKFGATASTTSFTLKMAAGTFFELPFNFTGELDGIWDAANGNARITELT